MCAYIYKYTCSITHSIATACPLTSPQLARQVNLNTGIAVDTAQTGVFVWWDNSEQGSFLLAPGDIYTFTLSSHGNIDFLEGDSNTPHQVRSGDACIVKMYIGSI